MYSGTDKTASPRTIAMDTQHTNYASTVKGIVVVTLSDLPLQDGQIKKCYQAFFLAKPWFIVVQCCTELYSLESFFYALVNSRPLYCLKLTKGFTKIIKIYLTKKTCTTTCPDFWVTLANELSFCHKLLFSNPYIFLTR